MSTYSEAYLEKKLK